MKKKILTLKGISLTLGALLLSLVVMQCTKVGTNASSLNRNYDIHDTTFASFNDTTVLRFSHNPSANDSIVTTGVRSIIKANCGACHSGTVKPNLTTYADVRALVTPGAPENSKLWQLITTNDLAKAMPPVTAKGNLTDIEKSTIYNWIKNGANETPALEDYKGIALKIITGGIPAVTNSCGAPYCHSASQNAGSWAKSGFLSGLTASDSITVFSSPTSSVTYVTNPTIASAVWTAYKDSVKKFYQDTIAYMSYQPTKRLGRRNPLETFDDIIFDIKYPKNFRNATRPAGFNPAVTRLIKGNPVTEPTAKASYHFLTRVDGSISFENYVTKVNDKSGNMAGADDGNLQPNHVAIIKGWYFLEPAIPDAYKYGLFRDAKGVMITKN